MTEERKSLNQLIEVCIEKLKILEKGIDPYLRRLSLIISARIYWQNLKSLRVKQLEVAGRITSIRKMGKASFFSHSRLCW